MICFIEGYFLTCFGWMKEHTRKDWAGSVVSSQVFAFTPPWSHFLLDKFNSFSKPLNLKRSSCESRSVSQRTKKKATLYSDLKWPKRFRKVGNKIHNSLLMIIKFKSRSRTDLLVRHSIDSFCCNTFANKFCSGLQTSPNRRETWFGCQWKNVWVL